MSATSARALVVVHSFLIPAVLAGGAAHELRWKLVNRAAGFIAGVALERCDAFALWDAGGHAAAVGYAMELRDEVAATLRDHFFQPEHAHAVEMILGENGLPKRLLECMEAVTKGGDW